MNAVGVDVNTASRPFWRSLGSGSLDGRQDRYPSGCPRPIPDAWGAQGRNGLGPKTFELAAGFLRIQEGDDPLDASGVHPEAYPVVNRILKATKSDIRVLLGNLALGQLTPESFVDQRFGLPTVRDIIAGA